MGIDVEFLPHKDGGTIGSRVRTKIISLTDEHEQGVNTKIGVRAQLSSKLRIPVYSAFSRNNLGGCKRHDGNELIKALKERDNYQIYQSSVHELFLRATERFEGVIDNFPKNSFFVPLPSTSGLNMEFLQCLSDSLNLSTATGRFGLSKITVQNAYDGILVGKKPNSNGAKRLQKTAWRLQELEGSQSFRISLVPINLGAEFQPFTVDPSSSDFLNFSNNPIVFVDDLLSTGTSISCASQLFETNGLRVAGAVTLLRALNLT